MVNVFSDDADIGVQTIKDKIVMLTPTGAGMGNYSTTITEEFALELSHALYDSYREVREHTIEDFIKQQQWLTKYVEQREKKYQDDLKDDSLDNVVQYELAKAIVDLSTEDRILLMTLAFAQIRALGILEHCPVKFSNVVSALNRFFAHPAFSEKEGD